ncbi:hypothetical protein G9A89_010746 [Geosiphon pyriformis]|nr:hypothetical protein G9A89_010746 [Geosiphon pyriformis]
MPKYLIRLESFSFVILYIFALAFCTILSTTNGYKIYTFPENETGLTTETGSGQHWTDHSIFLRLIRRINASCSEPKAFFRIIRPDWTVLRLDVDLPAQMRYDVCKMWNSDKVHARVLKPPYFLLSYINATKKSNSEDFNYFRMGVLMDWNGTIHNYFPLTEIQEFPSDGIIIHNVNPDNGFMYIYGATMNNLISWVKYSTVHENSTITRLSSGTLEKPVYSAFPFAMLEGGYGIAYTINDTFSVNQTNITQSMQPQWEARVTFLRSDTNNFTQPFIIFQTTQKLSRCLIYSCNAPFDADGYKCLLHIEKIDENTKQQIYMNVWFLSSGSVYRLEYLPFNRPNEAVNDITPLFYGGFLMTVYNKQGIDNSSIIGYTYDQSGKSTGDWNIPDDVRVSDIYDVYPNNTLWALSSLDNSSFSILTTELQRFTEDKGYGNPKVVSSDPPINATIKNTLTNITISFAQEITRSNANISIYQSTPDGDLLRQTFSGLSDWCTIVNMSLSFQILLSSFNQPGANYYVKMENNFIKSKSLGEPMLGIGKTGFPLVMDDATALLRLNLQGSKYYKTLTKHQKDDFLHQLRDEMIKLTPIESGRLAATGRTQIDGYSKQVLIQFEIEGSRTSKINTKHIINDLNTMIRYKKFTSFSFSNVTSLTDEDYGFAPTPDLWNKYKYKVFYLVGGIVLVSTAFLIGHIRFPEGKNWVVFQFALIVIDLILDITFIVNNGRDVQSLFYPSIAIFCLSILFNGILAFLVILHENAQHHKFLNWFEKHIRAATFFVIISGADVDALNILSSEYAGLDIFAAPFSQKAKIWIFWGSFISFFIEDIPQFIIQVLYKQSTISYDIIPFLTLITASIILGNNLIIRSFHLFNSLFRKKHYKQTSQNINEDTTKVHDASIVDKNILPSSTEEFDQNLQGLSHSFLSNDEVLRNIDGERINTTVV